MTIDVIGSLRRKRTAAWLTTYTFEPELFDDHIFPALGEPPLNVNILVDGAQIDRLWERWSEEPWRLRRINQQYLLRPCHITNAAFHPKTYLLANKSGGTLLVGSGNLTIEGLARGQEVFTAFTPETDEGRAAISSWRQWMENVVQRLDDLTLTTRWTRFLHDHPWVHASTATASPFVHNLERPILEQLVESVPSKPVDELHVLAPFFDASCVALAQLLDRVSPKKTTLYLPEGVSVDGTRLTEVIHRAGGEVQLLGYSEKAFVHAKLIGCVVGDGGVLLSGSPNMSRPALCTCCSAGNIEVAVITHMTAELVRKAFVPDNWTTVEISSDAVARLELRQEVTSPTSWPIVLTSVIMHSDSRLEVRVSKGYRDNENLAAAVSIGSIVMPLHGGSTLEPVPTDGARLAWLVDSESNRISNSVPIDYEASLNDWLAGKGSEQKAPAGLQNADLDTDLGRMLHELNQSFIFDIEEIIDRSGANNLMIGIKTEDDASGFWEKFQADMVRSDPRTQSYKSPGKPDWPLNPLGDYDLLSTLESMVGRFLSQDHVQYQHSGPELSVPQGPPSPNVQLRVGNVLARWCKALNDPRYQWIDDAAPVKNYMALLRALYVCRVNQLLRSDRLANLTLLLLQSFVGSAKRPGYLLGLKQSVSEDAIAKHDAMCELGAAMVYAALPPQSSWRLHVFEWQPFIRAAIENGVIWSGEQTVEALMAMANIGDADGTSPPSMPSAKQIDDHLEQLATFINDSQWCRVQEEELGFSSVEIYPLQGSQARHWPYLIKVAGVARLRVEPRIVSLVNQAFAYKGVPGVIIEALDVDPNLCMPQRLSVSLTGEDSVYARDPDGTFASRGRLSKAQLRELERHQKGFVEVLVPDE
jgi:hypothetical protein